MSSSYIGRVPEVGNYRKADSISVVNGQATYNLTVNSNAVNPNANQVICSLNGVIQSSNDSFTIASNQITFASNLVTGDVIDFILILGDTLDIGTPSDNTVGITQLNVSDGSNGQALTTNGSGTLAFSSVSADADNYFATSGLSNKDLGNGLHIKTNDTGGTVSGDADELVLEGSAEAGLTILGTNSNRIFFGDASSPAIGWIRYFHNDNHMDFGVNNSTAMSIDSSQRLSFGADATSTPRLHYPNNDPQFVTSVGSTSDRNHYAFRNTNGHVGAIRTNNNTTHYETSSDYRLKENEVAISDGITRLKTLKPYRFNFKTNPDKTVDGFFAHEVSSVVPEAISGEKDAVDSDNNPIHQGIDQSKLVPLLTSALQEAITKIETLEARVQALENA